MPVSKKRRNNKRKPAPTARKKPALEPVSEPAPPLPDRRALEGVMAKLAGGLSSGFDGSDGDDAALWQAQELMYEAWDTGAKRERIELAKRALEISDLCADAHVLLAETLVEARRHYEAGVAAGERALGAQAFERDAGHFWGLLETALTCAPAPVSPNACGRRASALRPSAITGICCASTPTTIRVCAMS